MRTPLLLLVLLMSVCACNPSAPDPAPAHDPQKAQPAEIAAEQPPAEGLNVRDRSFVPGERLGAITRHSSAEQVQALYGSENAQRANWLGAEGEETPATVLFKGTDDEAWILWENQDGTMASSVVIVGGNWRDSLGLHVGATLRSLIEINDGAFEFQGFGWDYGGRVTSWKGGRLSAYEGGPLSVQLSPNPEAELVPALEQQTFGDKPVISNLAGIESMEISVSQLLLGL